MRRDELVQHGVRYLSIHGAAREAGVSRRTIYYWMRSGKVHVVTGPGGKQWIVADSLAMKEQNMSLEIVRAVSRENPTLLVMNIGETCFTHTFIVVQKLRAAGFDAALMCKSPGESSYTPAGFVARPVTGLDGKQYVCAGLSHDAIWCDGKQYDTLGSANEYDRPIYKRPDGSDPNWSFDPREGPQIVASPNWSAVPQQYWRANNPPFKESTPMPGPTPQPPPSPAGAQPYPDEPGWWGKVFTPAVIACYKEAGRTFPDHTDDSVTLDGFRHWSRTAFDIRDGLTKEAALTKRVAEVRRELGLRP